MLLFHEPLLFIVGITAYCTVWIFSTSNHSELVHILALWLGFILAILAVIVWIGFNVLGDFQYISVLWDNLFYYNFSLTLAFDGYSLVFFMLTVIIMPVIILTSWDYAFGSIKEYIGLLVLTELLLILVFTVLDLFYFYIFFESVLIPMVITIFRWSYQARSSKAAYLLFFYTVFGSLFMLYAVLTLYSRLGSTHLFVLMHVGCPDIDQTTVWFCLFIGFAVKMPVFGLHIWLPEAHVEAPTPVSMLLASLLLKLGGYGFLHFSLPFFYKEKSLYVLCAFLLGTLGVIFASGSALYQVDLKRIVAYSSVAHMNLALLGMFSLNYLGITGSVVLMVAHGLVSAALFFLIGVIYDRFFTRSLYYMGGFATLMPIFAGFLLFFLLANIGFPGTFNFIGELYILLGLKTINEAALIGGVVGTLLSATYSMWLYNKVCFGKMRLKPFPPIRNRDPNNWKPIYDWYIDLSPREFSILFVLAFFTLFLGLNSDLVLNVIEKPTMYIVDFPVLHD